jgi:N-acetylglutamate synthase-like GNAT family acetyltransferase
VEVTDRSFKVMDIQVANIKDAQEISELIENSIRFALTDKLPQDQIEHTINLYTPIRVKEHIQNNRYFIVKEDKKIVGCVLIENNEMKSLYVNPDYMGNGIGAKLVNKSEEYIKDNGFDHVWIWANIVAVGFYESKGYVEDPKHVIKDKSGMICYKGMRKDL